MDGGRASQTVRPLVGIVPSDGRSDFAFALLPSLARSLGLSSEAIYKRATDVTEQRSFISGLRRMGPVGNVGIVAVAIYGLCRKSTVRDKKQRRMMLDEKDRRSGGQRKHDEGWNDPEGKRRTGRSYISHSSVKVIILT